MLHLPPSSAPVIRTYVKTLYRLAIICRNPWVYFLNWFGIAKKGVTYKLRSGLQISCREYAIDGSALNEVWIDRCYEPSDYGLDFDWSKCETVLDIGGHIGTFTLYAASKAPGARIITLEPDTENFSVLSRNVSDNALEARVTLEGAALGNGSEQTLYTFAADRGGNSLYRKESGGTPRTVQTMTLEQIFAKHTVERCDYLKLDCEGAEYDGLMNAPDTVLQKILFLGMEYHHFSNEPNHALYALLKFFDSKGFTVFKHRKSMLFAMRKDER